MGGGDLVLGDDPPAAVRPRPGGHALIHQGSRAIRQRAIDDIGVSGHPADIGGAPEHVILAMIEGVFMGHGRPDEITAFAGIEGG